MDAEALLAVFLAFLTVAVLVSYAASRLRLPYTVAMVLDDGLASLEKTYDVTQPLVFGRHQIRDLHPAGRPLTVRDAFIQSSNVATAMMALEAGNSRQLVFLARMGLTEPIRTEVGPVAPPLLPQRWGDVETATIAFGHGLAVAPLQFAQVEVDLVVPGAGLEAAVHDQEERIPVHALLEEDVPRLEADLRQHGHDLARLFVRETREEFLQQSAYSDTESFCPLDKQYGMLKAIQAYDTAISDAIERGVSLKQIGSVPLKAEIARMKDLAALEDIRALAEKIPRQIGALEVEG